MACSSLTKASQAKKGVVTAAVLALVSLAAPLAWAAEPPKTDQPTPEVLNNLAQNCASVKQSLKQLERADSSTRIYLGAGYERVATSFIAPLSLRLSRNNLKNQLLSDIQANFNTAQAAFRDNYTSYMRDMETLIGLNCQTAPADFYKQLQTTRARRETLQKSAARLSALLSEQIKAVGTLEASL